MAQQPYLLLLYEPYQFMRPVRFFGARSPSLHHPLPQPSLFPFLSLSSFFLCWSRPVQYSAKFYNRERKKKVRTCSWRPIPISSSAWTVAFSCPKRPLHRARPRKNQHGRWLVLTVVVTVVTFLRVFTIDEVKNYFFGLVTLAFLSKPLLRGITCGAPRCPQ